MSEKKNEEHDTRAGAFHDPSILDDTRNALIALVTGREKPIVVTGAPGTGKSVLIHRVVESLPRQEKAILLTRPPSSFQEVLDVILKSLDVDTAGSAVDSSQPSSLDLVRAYLREEAAQGRHLTLVIDEAHDLSVHLLTSLAKLVEKSADGSPFLGLVLVALPKIEAPPSRPELHHLLRSPISRIHLRPLTSEETADFVQSYFSATGIQSGQAIPADVAARIRQYSRGTLSLTNRLCLAMREAKEKKGIAEVNEALVNEAARICSIPRLFDWNPEQSQEQEGRLAREPGTDIASTEQAGHPGVSQEDRQGTDLTSEQEQTKVGDTKAFNPGDTPLNRTERLHKVLKDLQTGCPDVEASALITEDGLVIASSLSWELDETTVGGMSATLLHLGTRATAELGRGDIREVIVRGDHGYGVMVSAGRGVLLLVVANEQAKLGLIFFDMRTAINAVSEIL